MSYILQTQHLEKTMIRKMILAGILAAALSVSGCGKGEKVDSEESFSANDISGIEMDISSWDIEILASSDDKIHVRHKGRVKNSSDIQVKAEDSRLMIRQDTPEENMIGQFSFGKAGKITLSIPENDGFPLDIVNGSGDMDLGAVVISSLSLDNDSGHISIAGLTAQTIKMRSSSGDIKLAGGSFTDSKIRTESAYVTLQNTDIRRTSIWTGSGEVGISRTDTYDSLSIQTNAGDITLSHKTMPDDLSYDISSGSNDVTVRFQDTEMTTDTDGCKQGTIGKGQDILSVTSDSGTVVIK